METSVRGRLSSKSSRKSLLTNSETNEVDYQRDMQLLEAKRSKMLKIQESRRQALEGTLEERKRLQHQRKLEIDQHLALKEKKEREIEVKEKTFIKQIPNALDTRPRTSSSTISECKKIESPRDRYFNVNADTTKKREYMKSLMLENMKLQQQREEVKRRETQSSKQSSSFEHFHNRDRSFL